MTTYKLPLTGQQIEDRLSQLSQFTKGITKNSLVVGDSSSSAGAKGFYIACIDATTKEIYLCTSEQKPALDTYNGAWLSATNVKDSTFTETNGYSVGDQFTIYIGQSFPYCGTIESVTGNVIKYKEALTCSTVFKIEQNADGTPWRNWDADHIFYVPTKPDVGFTLTYSESEDDYEMWQGTAVFGYSNKGSGDAVIVGGAENTAIDDHTAIFGRKNIGSYGSIIGGSGNNSTGKYNIVGGKDNTAITSKSSFNIIGGSKNTVDSSYSIVGGTGNTDNGTYQNFIVGENNTIVDGRYHVVGGNDNDVQGQSNTVFGRENIVTGTLNITAGQSNTVDGIGGAVFGNKNTTSGGYTALIGEENNDGGKRDLLIVGKGLTANGYYQIIGGRYNDSEDKLGVNDPVFMVGGGSADDKRKTMFVVGLDGKVVTTNTISASAIDTTGNIVGGRNLEVTESLWTKNGYISAGTTVTGKTGLIAKAGGVKAESGDILATAGAIKGSSYLRSYTGLVIGADSATNSERVQVGDQNAFNVGIGKTINLSGAKQTVAVGTNITSTAQNPQLILGTYNTDSTDAAIIVANGTSTLKSNKFTVARATGNIVTSGTINATGAISSTGNINGYDIKATNNIIGGRNLEVTESLWTKNGDITANTIVTGKQGLRATSGGVIATAGDIKTDSGAIKGTGYLRSYTGLVIGADSVGNSEKVQVGAQNAFNVGIGKTIDLTAAQRTVAIGSNLSATGHTQLIIGHQHTNSDSEVGPIVADCPETLSGNYNIIHGDVNGVHVAEDYNALLSSGGHNLIGGQHNIVNGAGNIIFSDRFSKLVTVEAEGDTYSKFEVTDANKDTNATNGEANLVIGCKNTINQHNYSALIGVGLNSTRDKQVVVGQYNKPGTVYLFAVGNGTEDAPSNALTVYSEGTVSVGHDPIGPMDVVTQSFMERYTTKYATKYYVENALLNGKW